jgi:hypothetical protein
MNSKVNLVLKKTVFYLIEDNSCSDYMVFFDGKDNGPGSGGDPGHNYYFTPSGG